MNVLDRLWNDADLMAAIDRLMVTSRVNRDAAGEPLDASSVSFEEHAAMVDLLSTIGRTMQRELAT